MKEFTICWGTSLQARDERVHRLLGYQLNKPTMKEFINCWGTSLTSPMKSSHIAGHQLDKVEIKVHTSLGQTYHPYLSPCSADANPEEKMSFC
jgi:hypothetical protein